MSNVEVMIKQEVGKVEFTNYEEIKANISEMMALYKDAKFSDKDVPYAKKEVATLRKMEVAIDDKRKEVKKKCMEPYDEFEAKAKELKAIIEEPIVLINAQIDKYIELWKEERRDKIQETYAAEIDGFEEYLPLEKIYDSKWENKTTSLKSIKEDIVKIVDSTAKAINTITGMNSEAIPKALEIYKKDLSVIDAMTYINNYEQEKAAILEREKSRKAEEEERKKQEEIERIREEERRKIQAEQQAEYERIEAERRQQEAIERAKEEERLIIEKEQEEAKQKGLEAMQIKKASSETQMVNYKIIASAEEFEQIEMYLNSIGVEFIKGDF